MKKTNILFRDPKEGADAEEVPQTPEAAEEAVTEETPAEGQGALVD